MTRVTTLFQTPLLQVLGFDHPADQVHVDGKVEIVPAYCVTFLRAGQFSIVRRTGTWMLGPGDVLLSYPGISQRIFHPSDGARDECLSIRFQQDLIEDALGQLPDARAVPREQTSARSAFQMSLITDALQAKDEMLMEGVALAAAQLLVPEEKQFSLWSSVESSYGWYRLRIKRVCELLTQQYSCNHSLTSLAQLAQMSPFHLNRVFHYLVGVPLHSYAVKLRIAVAAKAIREGRSITDAAYSAGFNSISFFSRTFRKHFGVSPRRYRELKHSQLPFTQGAKHDAIHNVTSDYAWRLHGF